MAAESPADLLEAAFKAPRETGSHMHRQGQLFALSGGLQVIETVSGRWVQPPGWIGWIPPLCAHAARSFGATAGWNLYIAPPLMAALPPQPHVFALTPLVQGLVGRLMTLDAMDAAQEARRLRIVGVMVDELAASGRPSLHLPMPQDRRLVSLAAALADDPARGDGIEQWADRIGMARRTLTRRFAVETGLSFTQWRQQARLLKAVELLSLSEPVTSVALTVGYSSVSAFIEAFRRQFGCTPARFFEAKKSRLAPAFRDGERVPE